MKRRSVPRIVHVPWFVVSLAGTMWCAWGRGFWQAMPLPGGLFMVALIAWALCPWEKR